MKAYWYHISPDLEKKNITLIPRGEEIETCRPDSEPKDKRICVGPDVFHCLLAICFDQHSVFTVYRTKKEVVAKEPHDIDDSWATKEMWLTEPTEFVKVGVLNMEEVELWCEYNHIHFPDSSACRCDNKPFVEKCLKQLERIPIDDFVE